MKQYAIDPEIQMQFQKGYHVTTHKLSGNNKRNRRRRMERVFKIRKLYPQVKTVLCVGARGEYELEAFDQVGIQPIGIDISGHSDRIYDIDAHELGQKFDENQFDLCFCSHCLEHMHTPEEVLTAIRTVSRYGCAIALPCGIKSTRPSADHTSIFDIMTNSKVNEGTLADFQPLRPFEVLEFYKLPRRELSLFLGWVK